MALLSLYQTAFVAGEWSARLRRRSDLQRYPYACDTLRNVVVYRQGGVVARAGTRFVARVKDDGASRLIPFVSSSDASYMIELGDGYMRFFKDREQIESGGSPVEVSTPWSDAEIDNVKFAQRADVMYLVHPDYLPRKLSRTSDTSWTLTTEAFERGPFEDENTGAITITSSALSGSGITLTASASLFTADDVGTTWMLRAGDLSALSKWQGSWPFLLGDRAISRGKIYEATAVGTEGRSGVIAPDHVEGEESDGREANNVSWTYQSSLYAFVKITAVASGTSATATVVSDSDIPDGVDVSGTTRWSKAAFSDARGYPTTVAFWQGRLVYGRLQTLYATQPGEFDNHSPFNLSGEVDYASAIRVTIDDDKVDPIRWLQPRASGIVAATRQSLYLIDRESLAEPLGPENIEVNISAQYGTRDFVEPIRVGGSILMLDRSGVRVRDIQDANRIGRLNAPDRSLFSDHLLAPVGFEAAYCEHPHSLYWLALGDGTLACMTYEPEEQVYAWHPHEIDGDVESIAALAESSDQAYDDLWLIVARTNGSGDLVRTVEYMPRPFDEESGDDFERWPALDGSVLRAGAASLTVTGLDHLEGLTVDALADGFVYRDLTVEGGAVVFPDPVTVVQVGRRFMRRVVPLSPDPGSQIGASQAHRQKSQRARVLFLSTTYAEIGTKGGDVFDAFSFRENTDPLDEPVPLFTGAKERKPPGSTWNTETLIEIRSDRPLPFSVRGVVFDMLVDTR